MQAVKKFDPYKNVKFSYYASFWIKAYILKFIMDNWRLVKIGTTQGQRKLFFKLKKEKDEDSEKALVKFDPVQRYLSEISKYPLITREEERELGTRVKGSNLQKGDPTPRLDGRC